MTPDTLIDILGRENAALSNMNLRQAVALVTEKAAAIDAMRRMVPPDHTQALRIAVLAGENRALLERAMAAQREIIATIATAARRATTAGPYSVRGAVPIDRRPIAIVARA